MNKNSTGRLWPLEISIVAYILVTTILMLSFHQKLVQEWSHIAVRASVLSIIICFAQFSTKFQQFKSVKILRLFWPMLLLGYFYLETDYLNNLFFTNDQDLLIMDLEYILFGAQLANAFSKTWPSNLFAELMYFGYFSYYLLIIGVPTIIYIKKGSKLAEKIIFIIINSFLIYYLIFIAFPVVGPQFFFKNGTLDLPQGYVFGWIIRTVQQLGEAPTAAFPSSHVSICLMLVWVCIKHLRKLVPIVLPIAILLILSTVYIMAHYAVDVLAAFLTTPIIYFISNKLFYYLKLTQ